ncbi:MAG: hypothetical protein KDE19_07195 [Caldilineaceae bacterium]|nr:hypothetical protein [Caldilineaceae bacterium]
MMDNKRVLFCRRLANRQRRADEQRWFGALSIGVLLLLTAALLTVACGAEPTPSATVIPQETGPSPTVAATAAPTPTATAPRSLLPTVAVPVAMESPLTVTVAAADLMTDAIRGDAVTLTVDSAITEAIEAPILPTEPCPVETDIALAAYPNLQEHLGCAEGPALFDPVALNEFGPGPDYTRFMLWFSSENQIYVLLPDSTWQRYVDTWTEEQETFLCNPLDGEATSPPLPRRGFGKIWCTTEGLQEIMGTVEREERLCQHTVTQFFERGRLLACYEDATIRFFRIMDDGTWDQMLTQ